MPDRCVDDRAHGPNVKAALECVLASALMTTISGHPAPRRQTSTTFDAAPHFDAVRRRRGEFMVVFHARDGALSLPRLEKRGKLARQRVSPARPSALPLGPGSRLDRYELLCPIAEERNGERVGGAPKLGKHGFEKLVAIKTILPNSLPMFDSKRCFSTRHASPRESSTSTWLRSSISERSTGDIL